MKTNRFVPLVYLAIFSLAAVFLISCSTSGKKPPSGLPSGGVVIKPSYRGFLKASGRDIVDEDGKKVLLRGVNLGNWLLPEGYLMKLEGGYDRPRKIDKLIVALGGEEYAKKFWQAFRANYITEDDIRRIAELGFNHVRVPFNANLLLSEDEPPVWKEEGFQLLDNVVAWCSKYGLYAILDMHGAPGGQTGTNIDDCKNNKPELFTIPSAQQKTIDIWVKLAERYKDNPAVGGYDLLNEPIATQFSQHIPSLVPLYKRITEAVRQVDTRHIIVLEGANWANNFGSFPEPFDDNIVYSFHKYWNENNKGSIQTYLNVAQKHDVPLWCGEFGENDESWFRGCTRLLEDNNIGWCFWPWKKLDAASGVYSIPMPEGYDAIIRFTKGGGKPDTAQAVKTLDGLLENMKLANCQFNAGVAEALLKLVPGRIEAEDIGHLGEGKSYHDTNPQNEGKALRSGDGVDIEATGYNVGWLEPGEWMVYDIQSLEDRAYTVSFRVASYTGGGKFRLEVDGQDVTGPIAVDKTGGWKEWTTVAREGVRIPPGRHQLKFVVIEGNFNIDYFRFE